MRHFASRGDGEAGHRGIGNPRGKEAGNGYVPLWRVHVKGFGFRKLQSEQQRMLVSVLVEVVGSVGKWKERRREGEK